MLSRIAPIVVFLAVTAAPASVRSTASDPDNLVVHEWGTFTSIAGEDGSAIDWQPLDQQSDLPCFVERYKGFPGKFLLVGTVRMETPVMYFYTPRETTVDVAVRFRQGLVTEWFPNAAVTPAKLASSSTLAVPGFASSATWKDVRISPAAVEDFPKDAGPSHYYAARRTDAAPLVVGSQKEKFLFYRGVGHLSIPLAATVDASEAVTVRNVGPDVVGTVVLFESRNGQLGYQIRRTTKGTVTFVRPPLTDRLANLSADLEKMLVSHGLYQKEARAMIDTWRDSWFEEGSRLFYVVPQAAIDAILPLDINPRPTQVARVFVGRIELITPTTASDVSQAITARDSKSLAKFGRFLRAITDRLFPPNRTSPGERSRVLNTIYASVSGSGTMCR
jgi:hypothetical protein